MIVFGYYFDSDKRCVQKVLHLSKEHAENVIPCGQSGAKTERWCVRVGNVVYFFDTIA